MSDSDIDAYMDGDWLKVICALFDISRSIDMEGKRGLQLCVSLCFLKAWQQICLDEEQLKFGLGLTECMFRARA